VERDVLHPWRLRREFAATMFSCEKRSESMSASLHFLVRAAVVIAVRVLLFEPRAPVAFL
jgi:hypothetical protein